MIEDCCYRRSILLADMVHQEERACVLSYVNAIDPRDHNCNLIVHLGSENHFAEVCSIVNYPHDQSLGRQSGSNIGAMSNEKKKRRRYSEI